MYRLRLQCLDIVRAPAPHEIYKRRKIIDFRSKERLTYGSEIDQVEWTKSTGREKTCKASLPCRLYLGGVSQSRTGDTRIFSPLLYQLS